MDIPKLTDGLPCKTNEECISNICKNNMIGQGKCDSLSNYDDASRNVSKFANKLGTTVTNIGTNIVDNVTAPFTSEPADITTDPQPSPTPEPIVGGKKRNKKKRVKCVKQMIGGKKRNIHTGPRGGRYFIAKGRKNYLKI